jgi:hypothetical protein
MGGTHSMHQIIGIHTGFCWESRREEATKVDRNVCRKIILKWILEE